MVGFIIELYAREAGLQHFAAHEKEDHAANDAQAVCRDEEEAEDPLTRQCEGKQNEQGREYSFACHAMRFLRRKFGGHGGVDGNAPIGLTMVNMEIKLSRKNSKIRDAVMGLLERYCFMDFNALLPDLGEPVWVSLDSTLFSQIITAIKNNRL